MGAKWHPPRGRAHEPWGERVSHQSRGTAYVLDGTSASRLEGVLRTAFIAFALASVVFYVARFWTVLAAGELFHRLGFDWTLFYAQAMALRSGAGTGMY